MFSKGDQIFFSGSFVLDKGVLKSIRLLQLGIEHGFSLRFKKDLVGQLWPFGRFALFRKDSLGLQQELLLLSRREERPESSWVLCNQVHGSRVEVVKSKITNFSQTADGMVTKENLFLGVYTADCLGVLIADAKGHVACLHAGWRGILSGIIEQGIKQIIDKGALKEHLYLVVGPSIGPCCFTVKLDVAKLFQKNYPDCVNDLENGTYRVDLWQVVRKKSLFMGLSDEQLEITPPCTCCLSRYFYSYRREKEIMGHHIAFIKGGMPIRG